MFASSLRICGWLSPVLGLALLAGCASTLPGSELTKSPAPWRISSPTPTTLKLPAEKPFNIHLVEVTKAPGLDGTADADAHVDRQGAATASAKVQGEGKASGSFRLGQAMANPTDRQVDFDITATYTCGYSVSETPAANFPDAQATLRLYARQQRGRLLKTLDLINHTTENGAVERTSSDTVTFTVTLGPGAEVDVFFYGEVAVSTPETRSAEGKLELKDVQLTVATRPAPAVKAEP